jgi:hypothetical protein
MWDVKANYSVIQNHHRYSACHFKKLPLRSLEEATFVMASIVLNRYTK